MGNSVKSQVIFENIIVGFHRKISARKLIQRSISVLNISTNVLSGLCLSSPNDIQFLQALCKARSNYSRQSNYHRPQNNMSALDHFFQFSRHIQIMFISSKSFNLLCNLFFLSSHPQQDHTVTKTEEGRLRLRNNKKTLTGTGNRIRNRKQWINHFSCSNVFPLFHNV